MPTERLKRMAQRAAERRRERHNMRMLRELEPRLLRDLGLDRYVAGEQS